MRISKTTRNPPPTPEDANSTTNDTPNYSQTSEVYLRPTPTLESDHIAICADCFDQMSHPNPNPYILFLLELKFYCEHDRIWISRIYVYRVVSIASLIIMSPAFALKRP
jgi:hypothetical protein